MPGAVVGREGELVEVEAVLEQARSGLAALVFDGDPGIGKTTLWRQGLAIAADRGYGILSCRAASAETRLSFAALSDLLTPVEPAAFDTLPEPQRRALDAALLRSTSLGRAPDPRAIGAALVSLVTQLCNAKPLLLAIDDLQWLDAPSARAIAFALRRLESRPVAVLATARTGKRNAESSLLSPRDERVTTIRVGPLSLAALYRIVEDHLGRTLPRPLLVRIERASHGNPFYALEIVRALDADSRATTQRRDLPVPPDLRDLVARRLRQLPRRTRDALFRVSALAQPSLAAAAPADLEPAEEAGIVRVAAGGRIEFAHPLFAAAVYAGAPHQRRRVLHAELAALARDVEERARHLMLAHAGDEPDERVAAMLHEGAEQALRRGAVEAAGELEEQAARHTPASTPDVGWTRCLRAARHHLKAGDPHRARRLATEVLAAAPDAPLRAHALHLVADVLATDDREASISLLEEALSCVGNDANHAAQLEISLGVMYNAGLELARADRHLARALQLAEQVNDTALLAEVLAYKATTSLLCGHGVDQAMLERALALENPEHEVTFQMRASLNVAVTYEYLVRPDLSRPILERLRDRLVARGEERDLPWVFAHLAASAWVRGDLHRADQEATEALRVATLTGVQMFRAFAMIVRSMSRSIQGNREGARADATEALHVCKRIGWRRGAGQSSCALGHVAPWGGDVKSAVPLFAPVVTAVDTFGVYEWPIAMSLPDAIEAFVVTGDLDRADRLTTELAAWGGKFDRPWALAVAGRCRASLSAAAGDLDEALVAAERAVAHHARVPFPYELGRTLLVQGQVLRRRGERKAARHVLQEALGIFDDIGSTFWTDRTRAEIARIGVRRAPEHLTEGEQRAAELAASGLTNREIAAQLFMSRRTVEAHLARAYQKLNIRSRAELSTALAKTRVRDRSFSGFSPSKPAY